MRFSTFVSSALFVGFAAALPAPNYDYQSSAVASSSAAYSSSASAAMATSSMMSSSSSGCSNGSCDSKSSSSSSSSGCSDGSCNPKSSSSSSSSSGCDSGSCDSSKSSSSSDCSSGNCDMSSTSTMMMDSTSTMMMDSTSTAMYTSTQMYTSMAATSTADATSVYATSSATYGSGSSNWGGSGYNDCVQQCVASYGAPAATWTPSYSSGSSSGSTGTGVTHTVIVAPTQGVLRYVPFAVNASVGDTIQFMWNAKNHTVTKSSALEICNKTTDAPFASGEHDAPFTFTQVVNDTNPTFFYCGTPGHCQAGMFGMINPPSSYQTSTSVSQAMSSMLSNSSDLSAMMAYTNTLTANNTAAASWGSNIDISSLPSWSHSLVMENVMYTRSFLGANPETLTSSGTVDLSGDASLMIPQDMAQVNNQVDGSAASSSSAPASTASVAAAAATSATPNTNGAASTAASSAFLGVVAIAAAVLAF